MYIEQKVIGKSMSSNSMYANYEVVAVKWLLAMVVLVILVTVHAYADNGATYVDNVASEKRLKSDNSMVSLLSELLESSPSVKSNLLRIESAVQSHSDSQWLKYPTPSFSISGNPDNNDDDTILSLNQPVWTGGRITNTIHVEKSNIVIAQSELNQAKLDIAYDFIDVLGNWIASKARLNSYLSASVIYDELHDTIMRRVDLGVSPSADSLLIDSRIRNLNNDIAKEENQLVIEVRRISNQLGRIVSITDMELYGFSEPLTVMPSRKHISLDELYLFILDHPAIQVLNNEIDKLELEYKKQKSEIWPTLSVELRHTNQRRAGLRENDTALFINLESSWGAGLSSLSAHEKILTEIEALKNDRLFQIQNLESTYANELLINELAVIQIDNVKRSIESSQKVYESYKRQYMAGKKTWLELLNAVQEIVRYENELGELLATMFITGWKLELLQSKGYQ